MHSVCLDVGHRDLVRDESLGLNCAWYADILLTSTQEAGQTSATVACRSCQAAAPPAGAALSERSFVSVTVLLELEWVLRGFCQLPTKDISRVLRALASIEHPMLEDRDAVLVALDAFDKGLNFADAQHIAHSSRMPGRDRRITAISTGCSVHKARMRPATPEATCATV